jgi:hypothetical protein
MVVARHRQTSSRCHTVGRSRKLDVAQSSRRAVGAPPDVEVRLVDLIKNSPSSPSRDLCILVRSNTRPVSKIDRVRPKTKVSSWSHTKTFSGFCF